MRSSLCAQCVSTVYVKSTQSRQREMVLKRRGSLKVTELVVNRHLDLVLSPKTTYLPATVGMAERRQRVWLCGEDLFLPQSMGHVTHVFSFPHSVKHNGDTWKVSLNCKSFRDAAIKAFAV